MVLPEQTAAPVQQQREAESNKQTTATTPKQQSYSLPQPDDTSGAGELAGKCMAGEKGCGSVLLKDGKKHINKEVVPKLEVRARKVDLCFRSYCLKHKYYHAYAVFKFSDGTEKIIAAYPTDLDRMFTGDLIAVATNYDEKSSKIGVYAEADYKDRKDHILLASREYANDSAINKDFQKGLEVVNFVMTGNNGKAFDYDICVNDECFDGANSNTVQAELMRRINLSYFTPDNVQLPGVKGIFKDGMFDNLHIKPRPRIVAGF